MTEAERMFRLERTLGAIVEMCDESPVLGNAVKALCRINEIDPHEMQQVYRDWQADKYIVGDDVE